MRLQQLRSALPAARASLRRLRLEQANSVWTQNDCLQLRLHLTGTVQLSFERLAVERLKRM